MRQTMAHRTYRRTTKCHLIGRHKKSSVISSARGLAMGEAAAGNRAVVVPAPRPSKGVASWALDLLEGLAVCLGHDKTKPLHWLSGNFAPVQDETPPAAGLPVRGYLPECLNGEFVRVGPNPKFAPVAGHHWYVILWMPLPLCKPAIYSWRC